jgi:hypothetical protein
MLDLASRIHRVTITQPDGSNPLDVTDLVDTLTLQNSRLDQSGLYKITGKLTLKAYPYSAFSESLDPLVNRSRWRRGNRIVIDVLQDDGSWLRHPRGAVRILKQPARPYRGRPYLEIEIGCDMALLDYRVPPNNETEINLGDATARDIIINRLAARAGLTPLLDAIPENPINYPIYRIDGGYITLSGALAYGAGYVLWMNGLGQLRAKKINLNPDAPNLTLDVLSDLSIFEPLQSVEIPPELVHVSTHAKRVKRVVDPLPETSIDYSNSLALFGEGSDRDQVIAQIQTVIYLGSASRNPTIIRLIKQPLGVLLPKQYPGVTQLTVSEEINTSYFEGSARGYLHSKQTKLLQPLGVTQPDRFPGYTRKVLAQRSETLYSYLDIAPDPNTATQEQITEATAKATAQIEQSTYEQEGVVYPTSVNAITATTLTLSSRTVTRWTQINRGWQVFLTGRNNKSGGSTSSAGFSGSGNNQPPAPEAYDGELIMEDIVIAQDVKFPSAGGGDFGQRRREFEIAAGTVNNAKQLTAIGELIGMQIHGEELGMNFATAIDPFLSNYSPLQVIDVTEEPDELTGIRLVSRYVIQGEAFVHDVKSTAMSADGICVGTVRVILPVPTPGNPNPTPIPYLEPLVSAATDFVGYFAIVGDFGWLPYDTNIDTGSTPLNGILQETGTLQALEGIQGVQVMFGALQEEVFASTWNTLTSSQWDSLTSTQWDTLN